MDINTLSASLFGLAFYGLLGLWLEPRRWRQGLPAALLLIGTLPFGEHLQTFVGYPVRLLTAALVRDGLGAFGIHTIGIDTILVFESGISQIDLPCSGVKSLWTGGMFLLAATWIERRKINRRWLLVALIFAFLLFAANLGRVAVLVTTGPVLGWNLLAEMLHVPLGVLGFAGACAALVWMLRRFVPAESDCATGRSRGQRDPKRCARRWLLPALMTTILLLAVALHAATAGRCGAAPCQRCNSRQVCRWSHGLFRPMSWSGSRQMGRSLPAAGALPGTSNGETPRHGSLLLITSDTWRAHHRPERCFEAYGLTGRPVAQHAAQRRFPSARGEPERCAGALPLFGGLLAASAGARHRRLCHSHLVRPLPPAPDLGAGDDPVRFSGGSHPPRSARAV